jgi:uncharacterized protein (DUF952 family)
LSYFNNRIEILDLVQFSVQTAGMTMIYKILPRLLWNQAMEARTFKGASIDLNDGYIHFSTADQAEETARKHFANQTELVLVAVNAEDLGDSLRWEISRGGALFPHLYGALDPAIAIWVKPLPWKNGGKNGVHEYPQGWRG